MAAETSNLTLEQKERNKQYVLDHLEEYAVDVDGLLINVAPDTAGDEWFFCFGEKSFTGWGYKEIQDKLAEVILREKEKWEIIEVIISETNRWPKYFQHYETKRKICVWGIDYWKQYEVIGELNYREGKWKDYDEKKKQKEEQEKKFKERTTKNSNPLPNSTNQNPNPPKENNNPNQPDKNNPSPEKEKPNNSPLPPPADIQNQYNSDKAQAEITNNPNLTNTQAKQQVQELLKLIITAELLIKEAKTNSEILTKLLKEKNQNSSVYQLLNKDKRIDQAINQLQNMEKKDNSAPTNQNQPNKNSFSPEIILVGLSLLAIVGIAVLVRKKKKRNN